VLKTALGKEVAQVTFAQLGEHRVSVLITVDYPGARAGFHGIHIHANDNPANGEGCVADPAAPANTHFVSADGHFNPTSTTHGRHGGDFPNVALLDDGRAVLAFLDDVDLDALANRALILHEDIDNHGHVPTGALPTQYTANSPEAVTLTLATGNAGNRIACGLIR
jgi:Cu/Zn superoxide dismutase